jgi:hypothetical protein
MFLLGSLKCCEYSLEKERRWLLDERFERGLSKINVNLSYGEKKMMILLKLENEVLCLCKRNNKQ